MKWTVVLDGGFEAEGPEDAPAGAGFEDLKGGGERGGDDGEPEPAAGEDGGQDQQGQHRGDGEGDDPAEESDGFTFGVDVALHDERS